MGTGTGAEPGAGTCGSHSAEGGSELVSEPTGGARAWPVAAETAAWTGAIGNSTGTGSGVMFKVDAGVLGKAAAGADEEPTGCWFCTGTKIGLCTEA